MTPLLEFGFDGVNKTPSVIHSSKQHVAIHSQQEKKESTTASPIVVNKNKDKAFVMSMTMSSRRNPLHSELSSELRSAVIQRQDSVKQMYGYNSSRRDRPGDIVSSASWAASSLSQPNDNSMGNVLDELKTKSKRRKKRSHNSSRGASAKAEVQRLQEELQERIHSKSVSLYSADGAVSGDRKASLDVTKKSILDEIRRKSGRRKKSAGRHSSDDYGLLGSTKSNVLDELKKNSKKKKRRNKGSPRSADDGTEEGRVRPGSRSPIPSSSERERIMHEFEENDTSLSQFEENERALSRFEDRDRDKDRSKSHREDFDRSMARFDDDRFEQVNSSLSHLRTEEGPRNDDFAARAPAKNTLHSELKKRFKSPSRSRSLMYKYSNYRHDRGEQEEDDDDASQPQRAFLHEELQSRVQRTAPRYSRYSSGSDTRSSIHDELKSRLSSDRRYSTRSPSNLDSAFNKERNRQLDEGGSRHSTGGGSRGSGGGSRGSGGNSRPASAGGFYIPGITAKARTLESNIEDDVQTQDTHDETVSTTASSSFFIPGINGTARCLNGSRSTTTASRRASAFSTTSDSSANSGDRSDRVDRSTDRSSRSTNSYRRSSNYDSRSNSDDSGDQMDRSDRWESRRRGTTGRRRERSSDRKKDRRASSPNRLRADSGGHTTSVDLDDIIRGAQSKLSSAPRRRDF